ncbi:MAG: glycosyltransferase family 2 protein [Patescibacteria group bacterium]
MIPLVTVIIPNFDSDQQMLEKCIRSINSQLVSGKLEIILVDNGSEKQKKADLILFRRKFKNLKIIFLKDNYGFAKAVNIGAEIARGDYLFITNNDVVLEKNLLFKLYSYLIRHPKIALVGPVSYLDEQSIKLDSAVHHYSLITGLFSTTLPMQPDISDWISGSAMLIRKTDFKTLDGFDEDFFFYYEDVDMGLRIKKMRRLSVCVPTATMIHNRGTTAHKTKNHNFRYFYLYLGRQQLLIKHGNWLQIFIGLFLQFVVFSVYHAIILRDNSNRQLLKATKHNIVNIRKLISARHRYHKWQLSINMTSAY